MKAVQRRQRTVAAVVCSLACPAARCCQMLPGYNATIFAYGQTGSGKTHTMMSLGEAEAVMLCGSQQLGTGLEAESWLSLVKAIGGF